MTKVQTIGFRWQPVLLICVLLTAFVVFSAVGNLLSTREVTQVLMWVAIVTSLYVYTGVTGIVSFGHTAFASIGAYTAAVLTINPLFKTSTLVDLPEFILTRAIPTAYAIPVGVIVATAVAVPIGLAIGRLRGEATTIGTFAFLLVIYAVFSNWDGVTGGTTALVGIPLVVGKWAALAGSIAIVVIAYAFRISSTGRQLVAARDDEAAASACGVDVGKLRLRAFVLSAALMSFCGALSSGSIGVLSVDSFHVGATSMALAMLVVGGRNSLSGAVTGGLAVALAMIFLRHVEQGIDLGGTKLSLPGGSQELAVATFMLLILVRRPLGLMGFLEFGLSRSARRQV
ncbi:inner-membrane translocator (plasmid) [Rhizobium leguminosarum bv. trifolii WSM2304]|uniref:Inner-membrane translocator n=1 Tax=Rhizobium leguminosarum bv. trifolii (strain WSM2304) TaxID=395492 RepID=A0ABF7QZB9_RHILW|nr:branched-chain amino acid ABC transporter permease [Rhizobium leguminosarum]ACI59492.1 inner-membrane translocator [Rhizobium leguminosarum bv. trifolii WSM2304]